MKALYRISFAVQDAVYEIYARSICESDIFGFLEVEEIVFGEQSALLVDPVEEKLKTEFKSVKRTYVPMHNIFRIDEVESQGVAKIHSRSSDTNVAQFPPKDHRKDN